MPLIPGHTEIRNLARFRCLVCPGINGIPARTDQIRQKCNVSLLCRHIVRPRTWDLDEGLDKLIKESMN